MNDAASTPRWILWTPNALSTARLVLAAYLPFAPVEWWTTIVVGGGATDLADGYIARRFDAASWIGGLLDGVADKLFVLSALLTFAFADRLEAWQVAVLLSRDVVVGALAAYAAAIRNWEAFRNMPARGLGKVTTAAMFALLLVVSLPPAAGRPAWPAAALLTLVSIASVAAALDYLTQFIRTRLGSGLISEERLTGRRVAGRSPRPSRRK